MTRNKNSLKILKTTLRYLALLVVTVVLLFPLFWMVMTSIKPQWEWVSFPPVWIPSDPTPYNYYFVVFGAVGYAQGKSFSGALVPYLNSVFVAGLSTVFGIVLGMLAAYSVSRYHTGGASFQISVLMPRMFPPMAMIIPTMVFFQIIGALDTYWGLILVYTGFTLPYSVWMIKSFMDSVPKEFEEAAMLDGLSTWRILLKIVTPLIRNGLLATTLFVLILNWTEYPFVLTLASRRIDTITLCLAKFFSIEAGTYYGPQTALGILAAIPTIIFGVLIHRYLVLGFTFGAIKR